MHLLDNPIVQVKHHTEADLLVVVIIGAEVNFHFCCISILLMTNLRQSAQPASPSSV